MANRQLTPYRRGSIAPGSFGSASGGFGGGSLFDLHRQMNRLFDDLFDRTPATGQGGHGGAMLTAPALEVHQAEDKVEITAELPGVRQEDIDLHVEDGVLTLSGEKRSEKTDEQRGYSERSYGRFERSIALPANVDEEACRAEFKDGVLTITLPRAAEKQRGRKIPLGGGTGQSGGQQPQVGQQAHNDAHEPPRQQAAEQPSGTGGQPQAGHDQSRKGSQPG